MEPFQQVTNEDAILNFIFDSRKSFIAATVPDQQNDTEPEDPEPAPVLPEEVKHLQTQGIQLAEEQNFDEAFDLFTQAIDLAPTFPSLYNNRAQVLRMKGDFEGSLVDLNLAIEMAQCMADGKTKGPIKSKMDAVLRQAFTQRAAIYRHLGNIERETQDLQKAAEYGSVLAKMVVTETNPYATLCHQTVQHIMNEQCGIPKVSTDIKPE